MNSRPQEHDALEAAGLGDEPLEDLVADWAAELRTAVVAEIPAMKVDAFAEMATAAVVTSAASVATAAGTSAVGFSGGQSMSTLFASAIAKFAVSTALVASVGVGGAVVGVLPDGMQTTTANVAAEVGIDLPRPDIHIDVDDAGEIVLEVADGALELVDVNVGAEWSAEVRAQSESSMVIDFVSESSIRTVTVAADQAGEVTSTIRDQIGTATDGAGELVGNASSDIDESIPATEMGATTSSESDTGSGAATKTSSETKIETQAPVPSADGEPSARGDVDLDLEAGVGLG